MSVSGPAMTGLTERLLLRPPPQDFAYSRGRPSVASEPSGDLDPTVHGASPGTQNAASFVRLPFVSLQNGEMQSSTISTSGISRHTPRVRARNGSRRTSAHHSWR